MSNKSKHPVISKPTDGPSISMVGDTYRIIIGGDQTDQKYAVIDMQVPPGGGPGPHAHKDITESFYILEGEIEFSSEAGVQTAGAGTYVEIPPGGVVHCFKNKTQKTARMICTVMPAGLDQFFLEVGQPVKTDQFLTPHKPSPEDMERMKKIAERYGQQLYPPDYLEKLLNA